MLFMRGHGGTPVGLDPASSSAGSSAPRLRPVPPVESHPMKDPEVTARAKPAPITRERIPMPRVANVFGARTPGVAATADPGSEAVWTGDPAGATDVPSNPVAPLVITPITPAPISTPGIVIPPLVIAGPPKGGV
jgi:hypothetical protein